MKPLEAASDLRLVRDLLTKGKPLPPSLRVWLANAIDCRLTSSAKSLDQLLSVASRSGGRLTAASKLPGRNEAIRRLAQQTGKTSHHQQAHALAARVRNHRLVADTTIAEIEHQHGRLPSSARSIQRILAEGREAIGQDNSIDLSNVWNPRALGHEHTQATH